jgi:hypothetical protein
MHDIPERRLEDGAAGHQTRSGLSRGGHRPTKGTFEPSRQHRESRAENVATEGRHNDGAPGANQRALRSRQLRSYLKQFRICKPIRRLRHSNRDSRARQLHTAHFDAAQRSFPVLLGRWLFAGSPSKLCNRPLLSAAQRTSLGWRPLAALGFRTPWKRCRLRRRLFLRLDRFRRRDQLDLHPWGQRKYSAVDRVVERWRGASRCIRGPLPPARGVVSPARAKSATGRMTMTPIRERRPSPYVQRETGRCAGEQENDRHQRVQPCQSNHRFIAPCGPKSRATPRYWASFSRLSGAARSRLPQSFRDGRT